jgi:hypothetical protein
MEYKTMLILPGGDLSIEGQTVNYEDRFERIMNNFDNPLIENPKVTIEDNQVGRAVNYTVMDDGLYFELEFDNSIVQGYPIALIEDFQDVKGNAYPSVLKEIKLFDSPQYLGHENKELNKELEMDIPSQIVEQPPQRKSKIEILNNIKKLIEKNGYSISDEKILELFGLINSTQATKFYTRQVKLKNTPTQEIKIFPKKTVYIEKYDEHITFDDNFFQDMITNFKNDKLFKPYMDEDHRLGEKYADINDLLIKEDGLYAKIELNEKGKNVIKNNIYSYISPEWGDRTDTEGTNYKNVLWAVTLTNIPALEGELPKLQEQIKLTKKQEEKMKLSDKTLKILSNHSLNTKLQGEIDPNVAVQLIEEISAMLNEIQAKLAEVMGQKEVAEEEAMKFKNKLDELSGEFLAKEKEDFFNEVTELGQVEPAELDAWKEQYDKSKNFVVKMLTSRPKKDNVQLSINTTIKADKISTEDKHVMKQFGYYNDGKYDYERYKNEVLGGTE